MAEKPELCIIDGPLGTELFERGVATPLPGWSAEALVGHADVVAEIHAAYAAAGADLHCTNTFRAQRRYFPETWEALCETAVRCAKGAAQPGQRVAGSIAPLEDCYRPQLSPDDPRPEHRELARCLAALEVDLLLCETFPHVGEALIAVEEALATGLETWISFTAGPEANLLSVAEIRMGAREAIQRGASAVLVNCIPVSRIAAFVEGIADLGVPFGAYANAGRPDEGMGWQGSEFAVESYADAALSWIEMGASLVGGCCGTGPAHIAELRRRLGSQVT